MKTRLDHIVQALPRVQPFFDRNKEDQQKRRRRERAEDLEEDDTGPEESVQLTAVEPLRASLRVKVLLEAASSVFDLNALVKRRKARLEEQIAAASLSPCCFAGWVNDFVRPR